MRASVVLAGAVFVVVAPALAAADPAPWIDIRDRGDFAEVIAHNVRSTKTAITPIRQRLEIPLAGTIVVHRVVPTGDPTIVVAEVDNESHVLSVKLTLERGDVKLLAQSAQAMQIGDDLHLMFPRHLPAEGQTVTLPEPTLPVLVPPLVEPLAPLAEAAKPVEAAKPAAAIIDLKAAADAAEVKPPIAGGTTKVAQLGKPDPNKLGTVDDAGGPAMTYGALGLALLVGAFWVIKRRKAGAAPAVSTIDIVAQRSLGGKAKIVWLTAGGRDMIVAVTAQSVRMLGQWPRGADKGGFGTLGSGSGSAPGRDVREPRDVRELREPRLAEGTLPGADDGLTAVPAASSPAIQGLMRLRQRQPLPSTPAPIGRQKRASSLADIQISEDVATDDIDADAMWAKEILAATSGRGR
jgi:hypothetical protein